MKRRKKERKKKTVKKLHENESIEKSFCNFVSFAVPSIYSNLVSFNSSRERKESIHDERGCYLEFVWASCDRIKVLHGTWNVCLDVGSLAQTWTWSCHVMANSRPQLRAFGQPFNLPQNFTAERPTVLFYWLWPLHKSIITDYNFVFAYKQINNKTNTKTQRPFRNRRRWEMMFVTTCFFFS